MSQQNRVQLFDSWAGNYDHSVHANDDFPVAGYTQVLDEVVRLADLRPGMTILELGIGTGNLAMRLTGQGIKLWGIDFSTKMLARAKEKLPQVILVQADLSGNWPTELDRRFDRVVSSYVLHEFELATKVNLLQKLAQYHLAAGGRIVVGDIAFPTVQGRERASKQWADLWDDQEYYWAADEAIQACQNIGLHATYKQISSCGGVFVVMPGLAGR